MRCIAEKKRRFTHIDDKDIGRQAKVTSGALLWMETSQKRKIREILLVVRINWSLYLKKFAFNNLYFISINYSTFHSTDITNFISATFIVYIASKLTCIPQIILSFRLSHYSMMLH